MAGRIATWAARLIVVALLILILVPPIVITFSSMFTTVTTGPNPCANGTYYVDLGNNHFLCTSTPPSTSPHA